MLAAVSGSQTAEVAGGVSVVVPTRDRPEALERCLRALSVQTVPTEVIVVDDGSAARATVERIAAQARATLLRTPSRGPAAARNAGARAAIRGGGANGPQPRVVCFLDDDCEPEPGWAAALEEAALAGGVAAGRTLNALPRKPVAAASQAIANHLMESSLDPASGRVAFAPSCNLAIAAEHLPRLRFDESFPLAAGEDREWSARAVERGLAPVAVPEAVVRHHQRPDLRSFARQQLGYGRGALRFRMARDGAGEGRPGVLRFYAGLVAAGFRQGPGAGLLVLAAQGLTAGGMGVEAASALKQRFAG